LPFCVPIRSLCVAALLFASVSLPCQAQQQIPTCDPSASTPYAEFQIDTLPRIEPLEVARTEPEHELGLMYRDSLPPDAGMLFIYDHQATEGYWMHNTLLPLSIAWIDQNGGIVDIQDMQPETDDVHFPAAPYWYALEVNQGWFVQHGVGVGQQVLFCLGR
jgi:uncharacterized membrane protein (UPF0127 family)